ncbi:lipopolysaccharide biosynthesis protein [Streptococcus parasanguinis]|uniref:Polysaccharide biosynthesis protein n=1 Tax=Streptococcus parasanguinis F0449 TaxID=1095733 RepID=I2NPI7_STRPA|nr:MULTISPECIES: lipopolysaccharide biosynthesis protein [Streptococcus]MCB6703826.1 lipopolysaccharide biosynthesis protein [Streptococcus parasanguinis]EIG27748.1 polysaccharide biosynthesis protein [Streptococcus parasanguinis F0449]MCB6737572.1 lipopolysaccharide biosynthesis protein [Streptococcus parasanguinis]MCB7321639.1 lipopolysaccharide biosynthesis protein [Streptococcus parasanguinis]MCB7400952.1 lipopolysaccharide biosynthesis protein [Streptococcus parasanguinis]
MSQDKKYREKGDIKEQYLYDKNPSNGSTKQNYVWNLFGTVSSSLISVVLLLFASRFLDSHNSDIFSIAYALGQQFFVLGYFQIRNMQSTDIQEKYSFISYHNTRIVTIMMMILTSVGYVIFQGYDLYKSIIILLLVLYRAIDAYSDVFQGYFQQQNRSDLAGKVQFYRSWICIIVFGFSLLLTKSLMISSIVICLINLILTVVLDYRISIRNFNTKFFPSISKDLSSIFSILREAFPLFINGFVITYVYNEAKIDIDLLLSKGLFSNGIQRDFNVLFMPVFVLSLLFFVLRPLTTQLSIYWYERKYELFYKQIYILFTTMTILGVIIIGLGYLIGTEILGLVYGISLIEYKIPFVILLTGGILNVLALVIDIVMTIFRKQSYLVIAYITTFIVAKLITMIFVKKDGILGASLSFLISMTIFFITSMLIYILVNNNDKRKRS